MAEVQTLVNQKYWYVSKEVRILCFSGRKSIMLISLFWVCIASIIGTNDFYGKA
jgi:hypothetical protein